MPLMSVCAVFVGPHHIECCVNLWGETEKKNKRFIVIVNVAVTPYEDLHIYLSEEETLYSILNI